MTTIKNITALEILDSRGNPTVMISVELNNSITASAGVPSDASTGSPAVSASVPIALRGASQKTGCLKTDR